MLPRSWGGSDDKKNRENLHSSNSLIQSPSHEFLHFHPTGVKISHCDTGHSLGRSCTCFKRIFPLQSNTPMKISGTMWIGNRKMIQYGNKLCSLKAWSMLENIYIHVLSKMLKRLKQNRTKEHQSGIWVIKSSQKSN